MHTNLIIRSETPKDYRAAELMTMRAFWNIHGPGCSEHLLVRMLRESTDYIPELSRVAELDGRIVGAIYYTKAKVVERGGAHDVVTFGPLAVEPTLFGTGVGRALLEETIGLARSAGYPGIVITGEPRYYPKFGFQTCGQYGISDANGRNYDALMCLPLNDAFSSVHGRMLESPVYEACGDREALERVSAEFPAYPKVKLQDGFLMLFEQHIGVVEAVLPEGYQIRFWELSLPARLNRALSAEPTVGGLVLFRWKPGEEAEITDTCTNKL